MSVTFIIVPIQGSALVCQHCGLTLLAWFGPKELDLIQRDNNRAILAHVCPKIERVQPA